MEKKIEYASKVELEWSNHTGILDAVYAGAAVKYENGKLYAYFEREEDIAHVTWS